ncbi:MULTISPECIES: hypothetical protein [Virgibacillus]|uniref:Uncharacterized protein n=1 Tax=Virgibacillus chiguensis TaxID=411959 RepID=A0A1M5RAV3_9BACI|nr:MULTISPECIES: hypothetical protein [Virgibacillus]SHH23472.1 hypothetical protein SAMN05421807_10586 [Virgibacillus chiguensis]
MKKLLVVLCAVLIITFGIVGYIEINSNSNEIMNENPNSITVQES